MQLDAGSHLPLYAQLEEALALSIADGTLPPGSQLPPEDALIERFAVSRTTVRTTVQNLVRRGLLAIQRGKGTFVTEPKITQELTALSGFVEDMQALGRHATARVLGTQVVAAGREVAQKLAVTPRTKVMRIQRVRLADGMPLSFDETFLPRELGEQVVQNDLATNPIFSLLEEKYETPLVEAEYRLEAVAAEPAVARALGVSAGSPIFLVERTSYTAGGRPVDFEKLHYRGDKVRFTTRLARKPGRSQR